MMPVDWSRVEEIYVQGIKTGMATFETDSPGWDDWNQSHLALGRLVAVAKGEILGWVALSPVSNRCIYGGVAEISVYVDAKNRGMGIGMRLMKAVIDASEANGFWTLQSGLFPENKASLALHKKCGFRVIGTRERINQCAAGERIW